MKSASLVEILCDNHHRHHHVVYVINPFTADPVIALHFAYWSNRPFLIFDIRALWRSVLSARAPECQKLKMVGY